MNKKIFGIILGIFVGVIVLILIFKDGLVFDFWKIFAPDTEKTNTTKEIDLSRFPSEYKNEALGFSFHYPEGFKITEFSDENGDILLVEGKKGRTFQVFIQVFDEEGPLTAERIQQDLSAMSIKNFGSHEIDGISAVAFESEEPSFGSTFEVWFAYPESPYPHGNYLYQITGKAEFAQELAEILDTWRFQ